MTGHISRPPPEPQETEVPDHPDAFDIEDRNCVICNLEERSRHEVIGDSRLGELPPDEGAQPSAAQHSSSHVGDGRDPAP
eukprot:11140290-Prorocentrum_lima.AAC.1